jgi:hypothetical protein
VKFGCVSALTLRKKKGNKYLELRLYVTMKKMKIAYHHKNLG